MMHRHPAELTNSSNNNNNNNNNSNSDSNSRIASGPQLTSSSSSSTCVVGSVVKQQHPGDSKQVTKPTQVTKHSDSSNTISNYGIDRGCECTTDFSGQQTNRHDVVAAGDTETDAAAAAADCRHCIKLNDTGNISSEQPDLLETEEWIHDRGLSCSNGVRWHIQVATSTTKTTPPAHHFSPSSCELTDGPHLSNAAGKGDGGGGGALSNDADLNCRHLIKSQASNGGGGGGCSSVSVSGSASGSGCGSGASNGSNGSNSCSTGRGGAGGGGGYFIVATTEQSYNQTTSESLRREPEVAVCPAETETEEVAATKQKGTSKKKQLQETDTNGDDDDDDDEEESGGDASDRQSLFKRAATSSLLATKRLLIQPLPNFLANHRANTSSSSSNNNNNNSSGRDCAKVRTSLVEVPFGSIKSDVEQQQQPNVIQRKRLGESIKNFVASGGGNWSRFNLSSPTNSQPQSSKPINVSKHQYQYQHQQQIVKEQENKRSSINVTQEQDADLQQHHQHHHQQPQQQLQQKRQQQKQEKNKIKFNTAVILTSSPSALFPSSIDLIQPEKAIKHSLKSSLSYELKSLCPQQKGAEEGEEETLSTAQLVVKEESNNSSNNNSISSRSSRSSSSSSNGNVDRRESNGRLPLALETRSSSFSSRKIRRKRRRNLSDVQKLKLQSSCNNILTDRSNMSDNRQQQQQQQQQQGTNLSKNKYIIEDKAFRCSRLEQRTKKEKEEEGINNSQSSSSFGNNEEKRERLNIICSSACSGGGGGGGGGIHEGINKNIHDNSCDSNPSNRMANKFSNNLGCESVDSMSNRLIGSNQLAAVEAGDGGAIRHGNLNDCNNPSQSQSAVNILTSKKQQKQQQEQQKKKKKQKRSLEPPYSGGAGGGDGNGESSKVGLAANPGGGGGGAAPKAARSAAIEDSGLKQRENWSMNIEFLLAVIGFAVDLGNIWRFPYICYRNGGGAFLIPYTIMFILGGLPIFYLEMSLGQYFSSGCLTVWRRVCPLAKGIGYAMCVLNFFTGLFYNTIISWAVFFFVESFTTILPWTGCNNPWNTIDCKTIDQRQAIRLSSYNSTTEFNSSSSSSSNPFANYSSPTKDYFEREVLQVHLSKGIDDLGSIRKPLAIYLAIVFVCIYFAIWKGVKSTGKAVWITALLPYFVLIPLLIRGVFLEGAWLGIRYYLEPQWVKIFDVNVWVDAAKQIYFSLGPGFGTLMALSSYNKFHHNCRRDAFIAAAVNYFASFIAGLVVFALLGYMATIMDVNINDVAIEGPGLVFQVYPEGLATMSYSPMWSILFFIMVITLGIDSTFGGLESVITGLCDEYPRVLRAHRGTFIGFLIVLIYFCSLPTTTYGGNYVIYLLESYGTSLSLIFIVLVETIVVCWIYGADRFCGNLEEMYGERPGAFWRICWKYISPTILLLIFLAACREEFVKYHVLSNGEYIYPSWAPIVGLLMTGSSICCIPVYAVYYIKTKTSGSFWERLKIASRPEGDPRVEKDIYGDAMIDKISDENDIHLNVVI